jgi:hypothetical protein
MFDEAAIKHKYTICYCCTGTEFILPELNIPEDSDLYDRPKYNPFEQKVLLNLHRKSPAHRENLKEINCTDCKVQYTSHRGYEEHLESKEHRRNCKNFTCTDCCYTASTQQKLDQHLNTQ